MVISNIQTKDKVIFNHLAPHPLQSFEWGEFRKKTGIEVIRLGNYQGKKLIEIAQLTIHPLPFTPWSIGYLPKGGIPSQEMLEKFFEIGKQKKCIFIKLEPNIVKEYFQYSIWEPLRHSQFNIVPSAHPLFTQYTFQLDLTKNEDEILKNMHSKTRYNIKVAQKHGVFIEEDNGDEAFNTYLKLTFETTNRQKFYAHNEKYHRLMWETLYPAKIAHLITAKYKHEGKCFILATWIVFIFNDVLYYPYGASSNLFRNTMASNLMMWEVIRFGKKIGCKTFDMWGSLGPDPDPNDPWYGFHRFKQGYGPKLVEYVGSFDLVINPRLYQCFNLTHKVRQFFLQIKSNLLKKF